MKTRTPILTVFTVEGPDLIRKVGMSGTWRVNAARARQFEFVLFCQNLDLSLKMRGEPGWERATATEPHGDAFMLARIEEIIPDPEPDHKGHRRHLIRLSSLAPVKIPKLWTGDQFPLYYNHTIESLGINLSKLVFEPFTKPKSEPPRRTAFPAATVNEIQEFAAKRLGVDPAEVFIVLGPRMTPLKRMPLRPGREDEPSKETRAAKADRDWSVWTEEEMATSYNGGKGVLSLKTRIDRAVEAGDLGALRAFDFKGATEEQDTSGVTSLSRRAGRYLRAWIAKVEVRLAEQEAAKAAQEAAKAALTAEYGWG
jgi:hypothetical protein